LKNNTLNIILFIQIFVCSQERNNNTYNEGPTEIYDSGRDKWNLVTGILEVTSLSREEPDVAFFNDDGEENNLTLFSLLFFNLIFDVFE
jgi:hypothetical protein